MRVINSDEYRLIRSSLINELFVGSHSQDGRACVRVCVRVCMRVHGFVKNEDIHLYNDTGMTGITG